MIDIDLRKHIGARLLRERVQEHNWNELRAARMAGVQPKTIRRIERGLNYEIESLEKYAAALGRPLSEWLREILVGGEFTQESERASGGASPSVIASAAAGRSFPDRRTVDKGPPAGIPDRRRETTR